MKKILSDLRENSFRLRGNFNDDTIRIIAVAGFIAFLGVWMVAAIHIDNVAILPSPIDVLKAYKVLLLQKGLLPNTWFSMKLNLLGLSEAILFAVPIGFLLGLFPIFKFSSKYYVDAMRYLPLGALIGLFITYFGIGITMKVQFLAFAILVYLIPQVILRVMETKDEFEQTAYTMGATKWQIIRLIYIPDVMMRVAFDIINLVAISWTYIIIAELVNKTAGIGALIYEVQRLSLLDQAYAALFFIIGVGFFQDKILTFVHRAIFPSYHRTTAPKNFFNRLFGN